MPSQDPKKLLEQIKADILSQNICPNLAQEATQLVMGHGNPTAEIVFIGEAPGKNEDLQGIPFVGAAGELLDEMLAQEKLQRADVYITNIVKYRPPSNRDPLPDEKRAFWPYLVQELQVIQPQIIATLGRHSMEYFLPGRKISDVHGQPKRIKINYVKSQTSGDHAADAVQGDDEQQTELYREYSEGAAQLSTQQLAVSEDRVSSFARKQDFTSVILLPLYHPAAALYNGAMRQTLFDDFSKVPEIQKLITKQT